MSQEFGLERRLAAVLAADVAGFSRLTEADEVGALRLLAAQRAILDSAIARHRGRIANTAGDSVLAEFSSAVNAVQCAVEAQQALHDAGEAVEPQRRVLFRIGIHVGDVMVRGGDLLGNGVNVAARLEALADAGGVVLSAAAHEQVRKILPLAYTDLGAQSVKNIEEPVRAFAIGATANASSAANREHSKPLPLPDKPSIAVLPFQNMSGDPEQEYFADGIVEDIITALSRKRELFVIARNSSFTYKGASVDIKKVGRELGVRYVLEGSVRKAGSRVRITGQLIEAETGGHIWADRYDSNLDEIFDLQDRITSNVTGAILPRLERAEIARSYRKPTLNLEAYDYYLRALARTYEFTAKANLDVLELTTTAAELDPSFGLAFALGANSFVQRIAFGWSADLGRDREEARRLIARALAIEPDHPLVLAMAGQVHSYVLHEVEYGCALLERSSGLDPNLASARYWGGMAQLWLGDLERAQQEFQLALRLSPLDPRIFLAQSGMAFATFLAGQYEVSLNWSKAAIQHRPNFPAGYYCLAASLGRLNRLEEGRTACATGLHIEPEMSISRFLARNPYRPVHMQDLADAYRLVGIPE